MEKETLTSGFLTLNKRDLQRAILMGAIVPALTTIASSINSGVWVFDWPNIGQAAIGGFIGYLLKNFFTPSEVRIKQP